MPSLEDVANEIKSILEDERTNTTAIKGHTNAIKGDTAAIKTNTDTIIAQLGQLDADLKTGFTNLSQGLQVLVALGIQANQLSADNNRQNDIIICWLANIANVLCDIKRNTDKEVALQSSIAGTLNHIDDISELVNAREAMEVANRYELEQRLDTCCPPEVKPVEPCFKPCEVPRQTDFVPVKADWHPVKFSD
jgi:hypothetical protein